MDAIVGPCADEVAAGGDPPIRDRDGNWTYLLSVVVDDLRQGVDLVVRGRDLLAATPDQIRLGRLLGRETRAGLRPPPARPPRRRPEAVEGRRRHGRPRAAGGRRSPAALIGEAAAAVGLIDAPRPIEAAEVGALFS